MPSPLYGPRRKAKTGEKYWGVICEKKGQNTDERGTLETYMFSPFIQKNGGRVIIDRTVFRYDSTNLCEYWHFEVNDFESIDFMIEKAEPQLVTQPSMVGGSPRFFVRFAFPDLHIETGPAANLTRQQDLKLWSPDINSCFINRETFCNLTKLLNGDPPANVLFVGWVFYAGGLCGSIDFDGFSAELFPTHWQVCGRAIAAPEVGAFFATEEEQKLLLNCPLFKSRDINKAQRQEICETAMNFVRAQPSHRVRSVYDPVSFHERPE